mmetsp:Transcript_44448/g.135473  ORF Transcript_44448/g.135473 Transcript_44448/m.135473 type:complete len:119 (-) Transcript_44448:125-481(-)
MPPRMNAKPASQGIGSSSHGFRKDGSRHRKAKTAMVVTPSRRRDWRRWRARLSRDGDFRIDDGAAGDTGFAAVDVDAPALISALSRLRRRGLKPARKRRHGESTKCCALALQRHVVTN